MDINPLRTSVTASPGPSPHPGNRLVSPLQELPAQVVKGEDAHAEEHAEVAAHVADEAVPVVGVVLSLEPVAHLVVQRCLLTSNFRLSYNKG